jgi:hypothetical protein
VFDSCIFPCDVDPEQDTNGELHNPLLFKKELLGNPEKVEGIWPSRWLFERFNTCRLVSLPSEVGTFP